MTPNPHDYDEERGEIGGYGNSSSGDQAAIKMVIEQKIDHPGEVNKARYQPQNINIIATMCVDGRVLIFDRTKHSSTPNGTVNAQLELLGHKKEGFGLSWNPHEAGKLATGSEDKTVRLWYGSSPCLHRSGLISAGTSILIKAQTSMSNLLGHILTIVRLSTMFNTIPSINL